MLYAHALVLFILGGLYANSLRADSIAVLGDSFSTGAVSHPALRFESAELEKVFGGEVPLIPEQGYYDRLQTWEAVENPVQAPRRLKLSRREYQNPLSWVFQNALFSVTNTYVDAEEYSWFYLLARKRKVSPHETLIAAHDGEHAEDAILQVDRVLDATDNQAVRHLFVFFSGMDLCAPDVSLATGAEQYVSHIEKALRYYMSQAKTDKYPSYIWLIDPIGLLQFASSPDILKLEVPSFGKQVSCRDLQAGITQRAPMPLDPSQAGPVTVMAQFFGFGPRAYCPSVFALHDDPNSSERLIQLGGVLAAYRQQLQGLAEKLKAVDPKFRVFHLKEPGALLFEGKDMAMDCFHLNVDGQLKIANSVHEEILKRMQ